MSKDEKEAFDTLHSVGTFGFDTVWNMLWRCGDMSQHDKMQTLGMVIFAMDMGLQLAVQIGGRTIRHPDGGKTHVTKDSLEKKGLIGQLLRTQKYAEAAADDLKEHDVNVFDPLDNEWASKLKSMKVLFATQEFGSIEWHERLLGEVEKENSVDDTRDHHDSLDDNQYENQ